MARKKNRSIEEIEKSQEIRRKKNRERKVDDKILNFKELDDRKNQHDEDIKPDTPGICNIEYLTVEEMKKIYGIEATDLTIKLPEVTDDNK